MDGCCLTGESGEQLGGLGAWWGEGDYGNLAKRLIGLQTQRRAKLVAATIVIQQAMRRRCHRLTVATER